MTRTWLRFAGPFVLCLALALPATARVPPRTVPAPSDVAAPPSGASRSPSGLSWIVLKKGTGTVHPTLNDLVTVQYTGWHTDGTMFDSSVLRGAPSFFPLNALIKGWQEGLPMMVVGEKRRFWIPPSLAYNGRKGRPQGMLVFDIELVGITHRPRTPPDVAAPPSNATRESDGLYTRVIKAGTGTVHPGSHSTVTVQYTGWYTNGRMFDSSVLRGRPATFRLDQVIKGWQQGVQLMVAGETRRFWIPQKLAYRGQKGMPAGTLVFDVTLLKIDKQ